MDDFPNQLRKQFSIDRILENPAFVAAVYVNERDHAADIIEDQQKRIEELEEALRLGVDMREKQKAYFKRRFQDVLLDCKKAERDFDVSALAALGEKKDDSVRDL